MLMKNNKLILIFVLVNLWPTSFSQIKDRKKSFPDNLKSNRYFN